MNRYESTRKVGVIGIIGNIFLLVIKLVVAIFSHSQALLADTLNSAGDIFSSLMTSIGNKIASVPYDDDHNFGHGKAEYIFSLIISIFMLFIASKILIDSIVSIIIKKEFIFSYFLVIVCILTIITKFILYIYSKKIYKNHKNILVKASMKDHRNDMLLTFGTLISVVLGKYGLYIFDGIFGSIISIYIMYSGIGIFLESYKILMDVSLVKAEKEKIIKYILKNKQIKNVNDFNTVAIGYKYIAILTIDVNGNLNTFDSHAIADDLEKDIPKRFKKISKVIVHVNPIKIDKE